MLALVTATSALELDTDLLLLAAELPAAQVVVWDDPSVDWSSFTTVVIRSAWDYPDRRTQFLAWARGVSRVAALWNPLPVLEWNTDKRYLDELAESGVPVTPTWFVAPGGAMPSDVPVTDDLVVKPSIGAGSNRVVRTRGDVDVLIEHVGELHDRALTAMVQPYLAGIDEYGETALVYLGGEFSHAVGKEPILAAGAPSFSGPFADEIVSERRPSSAQRDVGDRVVALLPSTAYARVDLLPGTDGPVVLEVELTEPSLFLECSPGSAARAAAVFRSLVR